MSLQLIRSLIVRFGSVQSLAAKIAGGCLLSIACFALATPAEGATLVADWNFSPANRAADASGNGNNLTTLTGVTYSAGPKAAYPAANFNGNSSTANDTSGLNNFTGLGAVTYSAWVDVTNPNSGSYQGIISQDTGSCCNERLLVNPSGNLFFNSGAHDDETSGASLSTGWHLVTMTVADSGSSRNAIIYVDGVAQPAISNTGNLPNASAFSTWLAQGEGGNGSYPLFGALADVRVYQGALTPDQVTALFNAPEPSSVVLCGIGVIGLFVAARRRRSA